MERSFLIVQTGTVPAGMGYAGTFSDMFRQAADFGNAAITVADARYATLPDPSAFFGILVTGSPDMVTDREPWSEGCAAWLRQAIEADCRVLGVCYGHQLIAHAFGGKVRYHPEGMELGTHSVFLHEEAKAHPLLAGLPAVIGGNMAHSQSVLTAPVQATELAASQHDAHQILAYGKNCLTVQFHPEFSAAIMRQYILYVQRESIVPLRGEHAPARDTPEAASILRRFVAGEGAA